MKISLITVAYNAADYIETAIRSVKSQDYPDIEYILIDGASTDETPALMEALRPPESRFISEPDRGIYDAMNKGLDMASGEVVGFLNADDFFPHSTVISKVANAFQARPIDCLLGDVVYVAPDHPSKVVRYFPAQGFRPGQMAKGIMPPHPGFFAKKALYDRWGGFNLQYAMCADFELILRFLYVHQAQYDFLPEVVVHMRAGGVSTQGIGSTLTINREMLQACREHGIATSYLKIYSKYFSKIWQLVRRPTPNQP